MFVSWLSTKPSQKIIFVYVLKFLEIWMVHGLCFFFVTKCSNIKKYAIPNGYLFKKLLCVCFLKQIILTECNLICKIL